MVEITFSKNPIFLQTTFNSHCMVIQEGILREEDALTDLSNVLGQLKDMSLQMHSEISRSVFLSDILKAKTINRNPFQNSPSQLFLLS